MAITGTDLFQADFTRIAGIIRAGEATISFTDNEGAASELAAMNVSIGYSQPIRTELLMGGKVLIIANPPSGIITIGSLLGSGLAAFITYYGSLCNMNGNLITIVTEADLTCDSPTLADAVSAYESATFTCHSNLITDFGVSNDVKGMLVQSQLKLFCLNMGFAAA